MKEKNYTYALLLSIFLGMFGADRFYLGQPVLGVLKFITFAGLGFWWFIDIFLHIGKIMHEKQEQDAELRKQQELIQAKAKVDNYSDALSKEIEEAYKKRRIE